MTSASTSSTPAPGTLDLLVLGGTSWLGGAVARRAAERGHRVTCLARGESGTPPTGTDWVRADRADPAAYDEVLRPWDAVVDVSWQPALVRSALAALAPRAGHWVYVSSCSVYADDRTPHAGEEAPLHEPFAGPGEADLEAYGPAKVACEQACVGAMGEEHVLLARAGLIGGYGDRSDRLGYWPARVARARDGEPVLVPPRDASLQVVDVEDLADWLVRAAEEGTAGPVNATGDVATVGELLELSAREAGRTPAWREATDQWLSGQQVEPWAGPDSLPLWLPPRDYAGFMTRDNSRAHQSGLQPRPLGDTVRDTLRWERELGLDRARRAGLSAGREAELLARIDTAT